jgi:hypothetical protein
MAQTIQSYISQSQKRRRLELDKRAFPRLKGHRLDITPVPVFHTQDTLPELTLDQSDMQSTIQLILKLPQLERLSSLAKDTKQAILLRLLKSRNPQSPLQKPTTQDVKSAPESSAETTLVYGATTGNIYVNLTDSTQSNHT